MQVVKHQLKIDSYQTWMLFTKTAHSAPLATLTSPCPWRRCSTDSGIGALDAGPDVLKLAAKVYAGLSGEEVAEIERIALDRTTFFSR